MFGDALQNGVGIGIANIPSLASLPYSQQLRLAVASLFAGGAQGYWFDNSRLDTIFQDAAGTTPGALEAPVGLQLDLSQGLRVGAERVTNGALTSGTTGWSNSGSSTFEAVSFGGKTALHIITGANDAGTFQSITPVNKAYYISFDIYVVSGSVYGGVSTSKFKGMNFNAAAWTTVSGIYFASDSAFRFYGVNTGAEFYVTNFTCKQIAGNHRSQSTSANRPTLSALYNLLTKTENWTDASWSNSLLNVTNNAAVAPDGTTTAISLVPNTTSGSHSMGKAVTNRVTTYTARVSAKANGYSWVLLQLSIGGVNAYQSFNLSTGAKGTTTNGVGTFTITPNSQGYYDLVGQFTASTTAGGSWILWVLGSDSLGAFAGDGVKGVIVAYPDFRPSDQATGLIPQYQRVDTVSAGGYDTVGFPQYDSENGSNSSMTTAGGGGGTTAFFWCAAVTIGKVGAAQTLYSDTGTNTGYRVRINASNQLELSAGNGTAYTTVATVATVNVGKTFVLTAWHDGVNLNVQINQGAVASTPFATATAGTASTTIGCDNGAATNYFLGRIMEIVHTINSVPTAGQIAATQAYCNSIGKAY